MDEPQPNPPKDPAREVKLAGLLALFDITDREVLARSLVTELGLDSSGAAFTTQLAVLLGRELTTRENYQVDVLDRLLRFHSGPGGGSFRGGGGGGGGTRYGPHPMLEPPSRPDVGD